MAARHDITTWLQLKHTQQRSVAVLGKFQDGRNISMYSISCRFQSNAVWENMSSSRKITTEISGWAKS